MLYRDQHRVLNNDLGDNGTPCDARPQLIEALFSVRRDDAVDALVEIFACLICIVAPCATDDDSIPSSRAFSTIPCHLPAFPFSGSIKNHLDRILGPFFARLSRYWFVV